MQMVSAKSMNIYSNGIAQLTFQCTTIFRADATVADADAVNDEIDRSQMINYCAVIHRLQSLRPSQKNQAEPNSWKNV